MKTQIATLPQVGGGQIKDYIDLLKLRVMSLVIFTAVVGALTAPMPQNTSLILLAISLFALAIGAGASGALNMAYDADIDILMKRTQSRPIPSGRVQSPEAYAFGVVLSILSVMVLALTANLFAAALLAFTIVFYALVYTVWLKRFTTQNIVIGGLAGALPPIIGSVIVSNSVSLQSIFLCLIIFIWTPSHFWALSIVMKDEYEKAAIPMLPNVKGFKATTHGIVFYAFALVACAALAYVFTTLGTLYLVVSSLMGAYYLYLAYRIYRTDEPDAKKPCINLFLYSIFYLFTLFGVVAVENVFMKFPIL